MKRVKLMLFSVQAAFALILMLHGAHPNNAQAQATCTYATICQPGTWPEPVPMGTLIGPDDLYDPGNGFIYCVGGTAMFKDTSGNWYTDWHVAVGQGMPGVPLNEGVFGIGRNGQSAQFSIPMLCWKQQSQFSR